MARASAATSNVAGAGPNSTAAVMVKISDTEQLAGAPGILNLVKPVTSALLATSVTVAAAPRPQRTKLDRALWHSADAAADADPVDVIITTEANGFAALRARLLQHGDRIVDEQPQLSVFTVVLHAGD